MATRATSARPTAAAGSHGRLVLGGIAATALIVTTAVAVPAVRKWLRVAWEGDRMAKQLRASTQLLNDIEDNVGVAKEIAQDTENQVQQFLRDAKTAQTAHDTQAAADAATKAAGDADCGYYFFRSDGKRIRNKWDDFDEEAELKKLDQEDAAANLRNKWSALVRAVAQAHHDIERVVEQLDSVPVYDSPELRQRRKLLVQQVQQYQSQLDALKTALEALQQNKT